VEVLFEIEKNTTMMRVLSRRVNFFIPAAEADACAGLLAAVSE
jgi:hypothetical protein